MIKYLAFEYQSLFSFLNIFSYITFRTGASILTGLFFSLIFGNYIINKLSNVQPTGQPIRDDGPESHIIAKKGTPTMGGLLIILSVFVSTIIWADLQNIFIWILLLTILIFGSIGFADDYKKIKSNTSEGISSKIRIILQIIFSFFIRKFSPIYKTSFFSQIWGSGASPTTGNVNPDVRDISAIILRVAVPVSTLHQCSCAC